MNHPTATWTIKLWSKYVCPRFSQLGTPVLGSSRLETCLERLWNQPFLIHKAQTHLLQTKQPRSKILLFNVSAYA